jgi:hypothetical protein
MEGCGMDSSLWAEGVKGGGIHTSLFFNMGTVHYLDSVCMCEYTCLRKAGQV